LPHEAGLKLVKHPEKPKTAPFANGFIGGVKYDEWKPFFNIIDYSYWNVELEE